MQTVSGKIEVKTMGVLSTPSPLINTIFYKGENSMTTKSISKICSVDGCYAITECRDLCSLHYSRWQRYGVTDLPPRLDAEHPLLFWRRVAVTADNNRCWIWQGCVNKSGYGMVSMQGKPTRCHHIAFFFTHNYWPTYLRHTCDVPSCVNPTHLIDGTHAENMRDAVERGRFAVGTSHPGAKLNDAKVREIRRMHQKGIPMKVLANEHNISMSLVSAVVNGKKWRHVT